MASILNSLSDSQSLILSHNQSVPQSVTPRPIKNIPSPCGRGLRGGVIATFIALFLIFFSYPFIAMASTIQLQTGQMAFNDSAGSDSILVKFFSHLSDEEISDLAIQRGSHAVKKYAPLRLYRMKPGPGRSAEEEAALLNQDARVEYAEADSLIHENTFPDDPGFPYQWGLHNTGQHGGKPDADMDVPEAWDFVWNAGIKENHAIIAVIDSGIDLDHPDLRANIFTNRRERVNGIDDDGNGYVDDLSGWDFINNDNDPSDGRGHGTHVSGIASASENNGTGVSGAVSLSLLVKERRDMSIS